jgi:Cof subfamily protein (haloacid dehalogenase superfamily)
MIRLIASDLDGTLLQNGAQSLTAEALDLIKEIQALGIQFVAASGRQYASMKELFAPLWKDIFFVAENGSLIVHKNKVLDKTVIRPDIAAELISELYQNDNCDVMVSGAHSVFFQPKPQTRPYIEKLLYEVKNTITLVSDLASLEDEIIKISAIVYEDAAHALCAEMLPKWSGRLHTAVSGKEWVDFTPSSKGEAIEKLRIKLGLEQDELVAFGDNFNDESMFGAVRYSYAMNSAQDEVRMMARHSCGSVEAVLKNLVEYYQ